MFDINHTFGGDLAVDASGDLIAVTGSALGQQRVLRRLLTNSGDCIWHSTYGAGLPSMIGMPVDAAAITGLVRSQIFMERAVARTPTPVIDVQAQNDIVSLQINYADVTDTTTQIIDVVMTE